MRGMAITCGQINGNNSDDPPAQHGWYATMHSWDPVEGMFPGAHYWDGKQWQPQTSAGILYWPIKFDSEDEAKRYADEHDIDDIDT